MQTQPVHAQTRKDHGKGAARQLRQAGMIPAVYYGPQTQPSSLALSPKEVVKVLSGEFGRNTVVSLEIDGKKELALIRDVQAHPVTGELLHVDLYNVHEDRPVMVEVPFSTTGKAAGVVKGGQMHVVFRALPIKAKPGDIPVRITVSVTELELNQHIYVRDVQLPEGVSVVLPPTQTLVSVQTEKTPKEEETPTAVPGQAPAAGTAAPPGGAAPAAPSS